MPPHAKARTWSRFRRAAKAAPGGYGGGSMGGGPLWSDAYRARRGPTPNELVEAYKSLMFFMSSFNHKAVCATPLRLYVTTGGGQARPKSYLGTKAVGRAKGLWLKARRGDHSKAIAGADRIEEVTGNHPLLDVMRFANPFLNPVQLLGLTVTSCDIIGTAYWQPVFRTIGKEIVPEELWALPAQAVWAVPDGTSLVPKGYQYFSTFHLPDELIRFVPVPSLRNPYMDGMSPARAAIQYARLEDEFVSDQDNNASNGPRPKILVTSKDPNGSIGDPERKRLRQEFNQVAARGKLGGLVIADGNLAVQPMTYQGIDPEITTFSEYALERTANCFDVPPPFYSKETNLANLQAAREWHAANGVEPRCKSIAATLTRYFHALDPDGRRGWDRLFWAFDPVVEEDKKAAAEQHKSYVDMGVMTRDAVALELNLDPLPDGLGAVPTVAGTVTSLANVISPPAPAPVAAPGQPGEGEGELAAKSWEGEDRHRFQDGRSRRPGSDPAGGSARGSRGQHLRPARWDADSA